MLNCLIVDDEPLARQQIENYIKRVPYLKLSGTARNISAAKKILQDKHVDLIFLDIKMPGQNGIDFLKQQVLSQQVIFITAFPQYAIEGFELDVTDYLGKPVTFERFEKACEKARSKAGERKPNKPQQASNSNLYLKCNHRYERISIEDILYIESKLNYIHIVTSKRNYFVYSSLKAIETSLPQEEFLRIHKSYLVAVHRIDSFNSHQVHVGKHTLPLSRLHKKTLQNKAIQLGLGNN